VAAIPAAGRAALRREEADLDQALRGTLALESEARRLSRLIEFTDPTKPEGIHARLAPWCESTGGDYAWVFDNPEDSVTRRLSAGHAVIGFDVTEFLDHEVARSPVTLYLFHLVRQLLDGRRLVCWMDEFWRLLADPAFESFAKDGPKTWRKLNGVMCLATQSASDVLQSPISRTIIEQTPTKIFFPNADANAEDYIGGFGLTEREFKLVSEQLEPGSRMFLVKQGHHSIVCQLDLKGFETELAVISGRAGEIERMHRLIQEHGSGPCALAGAFSGRGDGEWQLRFAFWLKGNFLKELTMGKISARVGFLGALAAFILAPAARAQMAVIDVSSILQLAQQVRLMDQELQTAQNDLNQARQAYQSMTGSRGMQNLLSGTVRNYLPANWTQVQAAMNGTGGAYSALAASIQASVTANAVLSPSAVAALSPTEQSLLQSQRQNTALLQAVSQQALSTTSSRFASIQQLINTIGSATDPKAILDLQARIAAEHGMLQTDQSKLQALYQAAQAEETAQRQRAREQAIVDSGSLRQLPAMGLQARN
jgi:hypothetical protein